MLRIVVISCDPGRWKAMQKIYPTAELFEATYGPDENYRQAYIPKTYQRFEAFAVKKGLGRETVIFQDDVYMSHGGGTAMERYNNSFDTGLLVYGQTEPSGMVAPKAFSASPEIHRKLAEVWEGTTRIGPAWMPLVEEHGVVLDVTRNLGGRHAPCVGCGN